MTDVDLEQAWHDAVFRVETTAGCVTFRVGQPIINAEALPQCRTVTVVTAHNPGGTDAPAADNDRAHAHLLSYIREQGFQFAPANGASEDGSHQEKSLAVYDLDEAAARALGARFGQCSVMYWDGEQT